MWVEGNYAFHRTGESREGNQMKILRITEINQTIVGPCEFYLYCPPNEFIAALVADAEKNGTATRSDDRGCPVTAKVYMGDGSGIAGK